MTKEKARRRALAWYHANKDRLKREREMSRAIGLVLLVLGMVGDDPEKIAEKALEEFKIIERIKK